MGLKLEKVDVWSGEIRDEIGALAEKLGPLAVAGADLTFLIARRQPDKPGTGIVFLGGLRGAKQTKAAQAAGLVKASDVVGLHVAATNKPGLAHQVVEKLASARINLRGISASVIGTRCVIVLAFDSATDRERAVRALRE